MLSGVVSGDDVHLNNPTTGTYDTKNVGTLKTVTVTGVGLLGGDAGNYSIASTVSGNVGTITQAGLTISAATHHSKADYSLFEGTEVVGSPEVVLVRGTVVVENDELVAEPGHGAFVRRARIGEPLAAQASMAR